MTRRMTPAQFNAMIRQATEQRNQQIRRLNQEIDRVNRANKQAVENYNRDVRRHNEAVQREIRRVNQHAAQAVAKYNHAVNTHNAQVRSNQQRLQQQINALRNRPAVVHYNTVRTSTYTLHEQYERVRHEDSKSPTHKNLVALSEQESANSIAVMDALLDEAPNTLNEPLEDTGILEYLSGFSQDLRDRWKGAVFALNPANPDAARHFCTSVREIYTEILESWADDSDVIAANPACQRTQQNKPTRRAKIEYLLELKSIKNSQLVQFVESDIDNIVELFNVFNEATHGAAGKHGFAKLQAIRKRVEGGIMFLATVAT